MRHLWLLFLFSVVSSAVAPAFKNVSNGFYSKPGDPTEIPVSVISESQARELFSRFTQDKSIPFRYPWDGCYARATQMAKLAESEKIEMGKVFVEGQLLAKTDIPAYPFVNWGWHVAPVVYVEDQFGKVELKVFDPGLFREPVSVETWKNRMLVNPQELLDSENPNDFALFMSDFKPEIKSEYYSNRFQYMTRQKIPYKPEFDPNREGYKSEWNAEDFDGLEKGVKITFEKYFPLQDYSVFFGAEPRKIRLGPYMNSGSGNR